MGRFIVIVLDGFGVGAMDDVYESRTKDIGANTAYKLLASYPNRDLPTLALLGLNNVVDCNVSRLRQNPNANTGTIKLRHQGCDTFAGHQELMGTLPKLPRVNPFHNSIDTIQESLEEAGYFVERVKRGELAVLLVEQSVVIGDNLEAELGEVYNVAADLNRIEFDSLLNIGRIVRANNDVARNIVFGGRLDATEQLINSIEVRGECVGVNAPKSKVYERGFQVAHLGYGVNHLVQVPHLLANVDCETVLIGKVADIVENNHGVSFKGLVDTEQILSIAYQEVDKRKHGFICINVQETDLSGHRQDPDLYWKVLEKSDVGIAKIMQLMNDEDVLVVTADHGNDPYIGHGQHTREKVPLLLHKNGINGACLSERATLADIGASVAEYFGADLPESGESFIELLKPFD
ncbi:phosphopentomutase [Vibrio mediterranei]|uniref:phosphopentomutase n=1 Tax=Vibrio mediterranei TaxID=689 RepID=UPI00228503D6|nr:phosphopentomutase [Vibrio mediterranei]MCY9855157.1 phosphopentomutase [Vibrio mediterranei]